MWQCNFRTRFIRNKSKLLHSTKLSLATFTIKFLLVSYQAGTHTLTHTHTHKVTSMPTSVGRMADALIRFEVLVIKTYEICVSWKGKIYG